MNFRGKHRKDYYFQDDVAFTEDHMLIYNLFVFGIPHQTSNNDLKRYFNKFGEVCLVKVAKLQSYPLKQIGFVNFVNAEDAARVLKQKNHLLKSKRVGVTACYSWQQPDAMKYEQVRPFTSAACSTSKECMEKQQEKNLNGDDNANEQQELNNNDDKQTSILKITELNDDVLEHVCSFLQMKDQIAFARTCKRFQDIFIMHSKLKYKMFDITELHQLTLWQTRDFFQLCGPHITSLSGSIPSRGCNRIAEFCGSYCVNVATIHMSSFNFTSLHLKKFLNQMTAITEIDITGNAINDHSVYLLSKLDHLKILRTANNIEVTGKYMNLLIHIEELVLKSCINLRESYLVDILKELKNLCTFDIQYSELRNETFKALIQYGTSIEVLKISAPGVVPYDGVATMPKLKHLEVINDCNFNSDIFGKLAEHKSDQLEVLMYKSKFYSGKSFSQKNIKNIAKLHKLKVLSCSIRYVVDTIVLSEFTELKELTSLRLSGKFFAADDLLKIIKKCHKLKHLNINRCSQITEEFIIEALKILEDLNRRQLRNYPLCIMASESHIDVAIKRSPELTEKEHLLQLCLHEPFRKQEFFNDLHMRCMNFYGDELTDDDDYLTGAAIDDLDDPDLSNSDHYDSDVDDFDALFDDMETIEFYMCDLLSNAGADTESASDLNNCDYLANNDLDPEYNPTDDIDNRFIPLPDFDGWDSIDTNGKPYFTTSNFF